MGTRLHYRPARNPAHAPRMPSSQGNPSWLTDGYPAVLRMDADGIPTPRNEAGGRQRRSGGCWRPSRFHYLAVSEISQEQLKLMWLMPCFEIPDQANEEAALSA